MKYLTLLILMLVMAACGQQQAIELPEGVVCDDAAMATIRERGLNPRGDVNSPEYDENYAMSFFRAVGCEAPAPSFDS